MYKLKRLKEKRAEHQNKMKAMLEKAEEEKRSLEKEEIEEFDKCEEKIKRIDDTIERIEKTRSLEKTGEKKNELDEKNVEEREMEAFEDFVRGKTENRENEIQLTQGGNGSIIPKTIADKIIKKVRDTVPYLEISDVIRTNGLLAIPVYEEDAQNYIKADYIDEGKPLTDNIGKFKSVDLTGYVIGALALVSKKLVNNTDISITDFVVEEVARAISEKIEKEFTVGTVGKITGLSSGTVRVTTQKSGTIAYDELVDLKHSLKKEFRKNGIFVMNDDTYKEICKLKDGEGRPYFDDDSYEILGCKVEVSDSMPSYAETGAKAIIFADMTGYTIKETKEVEIQILLEKYSDRNMLGIMAFVEYDAKISDAKKIAVLQMAA